MPYRRQWNRPYNTIIERGEGPGDISADWEIYTDGSLVDGQSGSGVVFKRNDLWVDSISVPLKEATVYQSELKAIELAAFELQPHVSEGDFIRIFVDNQAAILALGSVEERQWSVHNTSNELCELASKCGKIEIEWCRGHIGIEGNELADVAAKDGSKMEEGHLHVKMPVASLKKILHQWSHQAWIDEWEAETNPVNGTPKCRQTRYFYKKPSKHKAKLLMNYNREKLSMFVRYVTGHAFLKRHNMIVEKGTKVGIENEDIFCRLCESDTDWETPHHIICKCPALMHRRMAMFGEFMLPDDPEWSVKNLMDFLDCMTISELEEEDE